MKFFDKILEILFKPRVYVPILAITIGYLIYRIIKSGVKRALEYGSKSAYETKKRKTIVELSSNVIKYIRNIWYRYEIYYCWIRSVFCSNRFSFSRYFKRFY